MNLKSHSPVGCKFLTYKAARDLRDNVAPKEGAVDHPHCFRIPCELGRLEKWKEKSPSSDLHGTRHFHKETEGAACVGRSTSHPTHHQHFLVALVDGVIVDHAHNGHAQIAPDAERDAEAQAGQDGDDVAARQAEAGAIHNGQFLLLHQLGTSLRRQLDSFAIRLPLLDQPEGDT